MAAQPAFVRLERSKPPHRPVGIRQLDQAADDSEVIEVAALVRSRGSAAELADMMAGLQEQLPHQRRYLSHDEYRQSFGASDEALDKLEKFSRDNQLKTVLVNREGRLAILRGTVKAFARAFSVEFRAVHAGGRDCRTIDGDVHLPKELEGVVDGIFGLDDIRRFERPFGAGDQPLAATAPAARGRFTDAREVGQHYGFPAQQNGKGQCVGVILLGGGFNWSDMSEYFGGRVDPRPQICTVDLGGGTNNPLPAETVRQALEMWGMIPPGGAPRADPATIDPTRVLWTIEATLDVQLVGTFANGADVVVYFAPGDERGKIEALATAISDRKHSPSVITCSWGAPEDNLSPAYLAAVDRILQAAALKGITVCYSSGDRGADTVDGKARVHFPASSPHVLACGGTTLDLQGATPEVAWCERLGPKLMATGGGFSEFFARPDWQVPEGTTGLSQWKNRGVPDVAGKADLAHGYEMIVAGVKIPMGGTSAAAPMWAGLTARLNEALQTRVGWMTPLLYRKELRAILHDITSGENGTYRARPGWDPCTGLGSPVGMELLRKLKSEA